MSLDRFLDQHSQQIHNARQRAVAKQPPPKTVSTAIPTPQPQRPPTAPAVARPAPDAATAAPVATIPAPVLAPPPSQPTGDCTCSCEEWTELQKMIESVQTLSDADKMKLVTDHDALGYYANRYGLDVVGTVIPAYSTNAEPSARELAELQEIIREFETKAVFVGSTVNPVLAAQLAEDTGIKLVPLYTGSLGEAGSGVETYMDLIRYNTTAIVTALK